MMKKILSNIGHKPKCDGKSIITFKEATAGMSREEIELKDLPLRGMDVKKLQDMCEFSLSKTRHVYHTWRQLEEKQHREVWEIDVFHGPLDGLIIAEIELPSEDYEFERPPWLGEEITSRGEYYNYTLAKNQSYPGQEFFHDKTAKCEMCEQVNCINKNCGPCAGCETFDNLCEECDKGEGCCCPC